MGGSDKAVFMQQKKFMISLTSEFLNHINKNDVKKIAILGSPGENIVIKAIQDMYLDAKISYYDIQLDNWDINKVWNITDYDIVICFRVTPYVDCIDHFSIELKKCIKNNKHCVFDFSLFVGQIEEFSYEKTKVLGGYLPPNLNAKFDLRSLFSDSPDLIDYNRIYFWGSRPKPVIYHQEDKDNFYGGIIKNTFTVHNLVKMGVFPLALTTRWNPLTQNAYITYMYFCNNAFQYIKNTSDPAYSRMDMQMYSYIQMNQINNTVSIESIYSAQTAEYP